MPLCGYSVEPSDSMIPCDYKLQNINIIWIAIYKEHKWEETFFFFTGVMAEGGQWLPYHLLVMEQHQAAQMSR